MKRYFIPTNGETLIYLNHHCLTFFFLVYFLITSMHVYWASLIAQLIKESTCNVRPWDRSLGWEDPLEEGMATHSTILTWRIPMDAGGWWATVHGVTKSQIP